MTISMSATRSATIPLIRGVIASVTGVLVGVLLAGAIVTILATQFFGFRVLTVRSGSMEPSLQKGEVIVTRPVHGRDIAEGDVVVYRATDDLSVVHRVLGVNKIILNLVDSKTGGTDSTTSYQFVTKGDANGAPDALPVDQGAVEGRLWFTLPVAIGDMGGLRLQWMFLILAASLAAMWIVWEIRHRAPRI